MIVTVGVYSLELCDRLVINIPRGLVLCILPFENRGSVSSVRFNDRLSLSGSGLGRSVSNDCSYCEGVFHCVESKLVLFCYDNLKFYIPFILRLLYVIHCSRTI